MGIVYLRCRDEKCHFYTNPMTWPENQPPIPCPLCQSPMDKVERLSSVVESPVNAGGHPGGVVESPVNAGGHPGREMNVREDWLSALEKNENLWIPDAETSYPAVIAYEYRTLRRFCGEKRAYAVLLSLKDNFEALLKLEVLLAFAWAAQNGDEVFESQTISQLMMPKPSLGMWLSLASVIVKDLRKAGMELPACIPLDKIRKEYDRKGIVNWRNEKIGHGAMGLSEDEEFRKDIEEKIEILKKLLKSIDEQLREQELYLPVDAAGKETELILTGADMARGMARSGFICFRTRDRRMRGDL